MKDLLCDMCEVNCQHPETICRAKAEMLAENTIQQLADTFKILGDNTRIKILTVLSRQEMCVCDIAETLEMGQSTISHQLRVLRGAKLVKFRKEGKEAWYSLDDNHVVDLLRLGIEHINHA